MSLKYNTKKKFFCTFKTIQNILKMYLHFEFIFFLIDKNFRLNIFTLYLLIIFVIDFYKFTFS